MNMESKIVMWYYDDGLSVNAIADATDFSIDKIDKIISHQLELRAAKAAKRAEKNTPIVLTYERLKSVKKTANELNISVAKVYKALNEENVKLDRRADNTKERQKQIVADYRSGKSIEEIAKKYDISLVTVYNALEQENVKLRKTCRRTQKTDQIITDILASARCRGWKSQLAKKYGISRQRVDQIISYYNLK